MVLPAQQSNFGLTVVYRIDRDDRIVEVNDAWATFAANNGGGSLSAADVTGHVLWEFIADDTTVHLYRIMCSQLRHGTPCIRFQFRCDAPELRRLLAMEMTCADNDCIQFTVEGVAEQARAAVPFVGVSRPSSGEGLITLCSWCKRVRLPDLSWVEIEDGIEPLGLFQSNSDAPAVTHGICERCERALADVGDELVTLGPLPGEGS